MPRLRTDDGPRKLRAVWLGPAGHTLPFQWSYVQWALTLVIVTVTSTIGTLLVWWLLRDPVWAFGLGTLWFGAAGVYLGVRVMRNVTFDEPLGYQRRMVKEEFSSKFAKPVGTRQMAVTFEIPPITYLPSAVRRCMDWHTLADQQPLPNDSLVDPEERAPLPDPDPVPEAATNPYLALSPRSPATAVPPSASAEPAPLDTSPATANPYLTPRS